MSRLASLLFACALLIASAPPSWALAQSTEDPWDKPLNLSRSGVATNPAIVSDSDGVIHVVWQDDLENYVYSRFNGEQWSTPQTTNLDGLFILRVPGTSLSQMESAVYTGPNPLFIAGPGDYTFAFWLNSLGRLWMSRVKNGDFDHRAAWDSVSLITQQAASFAAAVDAQGEWHLAYFRTAAEPGYSTGVYYTRSKSNGRYWTVPVLLYESDYFRGLAQGEANLSLFTAGTKDAPRVYVAWDNRPRKQVFLAQSADGGKNWEQPALIAGPAPDAGLAGPFNIHVSGNEDSVILVWQNGQPGVSCSQVYQFSSDAGASWSAQQMIGDDLLGCPQSTEFVTTLANDPERPLYLLNEMKGQIFLAPWNGIQWNQPQAQQILSGFQEPEIYTEVIYGCHRAALSGDRLYIVGCDEGGGGDIWVTSRDLGAESFRVEPPVWSQPSSVTSEELDVEAVKLVTTEDGLIHAFFNQHRDRGIYYVYWDGESWSHLTQVLRLPDGEAGSPAVATGPGGELFLVTPNNSGALYFSRATSDNAATKSSWSSPTQVAISQSGKIGSVDVAWDATGTIYVAYSVPVNEERGIYLVQSKDRGATWSEPLQVFNGGAAGYDLIGAPSLVASPDGLLHMMWKVQSIQGYGIPRPLALYYARSEDWGYSFNDAEQVVEEPVAWQGIVADGENNLHLLWQPQDTMTTVWDQVSLDEGNSWQFPHGLPNNGELAAVTRDPAGRLHVVGVGSSTLDLWLWDGGRWQSEEPIQWSSASGQEGSVEVLEAVVNKDGEMVVVLVGPTDTGNAVGMTLLYTTRTLQLPSERTAGQVIPTPTRLPATSTPEPTPETLLTPNTLVDNGSANENQIDGVQSDDPITPLTLALLPVALLLLGVLGMVIRQAAQAKDR